MTAAPQWPGDDVGEVILTADQIQTRTAELGGEITADYAGRAPLLVSVLKGAFVFMADLCRHIDLPVETEFMAVSSYGASTKSSGVVQIVKDLDVDISGRDVIVVEDIVDTGLTLSYLRDNLGSRKPASLAVCSLLLREVPDQDPPDIHYVGFRLPPVFVIGYGLDVDARYRNLPAIHAYRS